MHSLTESKKRPKHKQQLKFCSLTKLFLLVKEFSTLPVSVCNGLGYSKHSFHMGGGWERPIVTSSSDLKNTKGGLS